MNKKLGQLFWTFLKIGAFTFGGGYAMIALLENEFIARTCPNRRLIWLDDDILDMLAIAESTPGPVAINSATYIGYKLGRVPGAIVSTVAVSLPSFAIIYLISLFFDRFLSLTYVACAFRGIQVCVVYLIFSAGVRMLKSLPKDGLSRAILAGVFVLSAAFSLCAVRFSSVFFILIAGGLSLLVWSVRARCGKGGEEK